MKNLFFLLISLIFLSQLPAQTLLEGKVTDGESGEKLVGVGIVVEKAGTDIARAISDVDGNYKIELDSGTYNLKATFIGYQPKIVKRVRIFADKENVLDFALRQDEIELDEVVSRPSRFDTIIVFSPETYEEVIEVVEYEVPLISKDNTTMGTTITADEIRRLPTRDMRSTSPSAAGVAGATSPGSLKKATRGEAYSYDAAKSKSPKKSKKESVAHEYAFSDDASEFTEKKVVVESGEVAEVKEMPEPEYGLLTAGEWNDLDNWDFWMDDMENPEKEGFEKHWEIFPRQRYTFRLTNHNYQPVVDAEVNLVNKSGTVIWTARSDYEGKAELWANFFEGEEKKFNILVNYNGKKETLKLVKPVEEGINHLKLYSGCHPSANVDVCFVVDATGSMGDEIEYLKAELKDVVQRVKDHNRDLSVRLGSVFYRDETDSYVTQASPFSNNVEQTLQFIRNQSAGGGGDYPEAVHSALEEAVQKMEWREEARARLLFLVLDAPPHHNPEVLESLKRSVNLAAQKGIKIIPVTASGIKKDTEYLMKFFALATNGTYVFVTDHSGIGNAHIEATAKDYEVEYLNDLLVRLIKKYTRKMCDAEDRWMGREESPAQARLRNSIKIYPNPAVDHFFVDLKEAVDNFTLSDVSGKVIKKYGMWQNGSSRLDIGNLGPGAYILTFVKGEVTVVKKLVVVKK